ncbi:MAG: hypothetical protein ACK4ZU_03615 [Allorhizobium sp.]
MERMAESDLGITAQRIDENARSMETVMDAIGSLDPLHRLFAQNYADRFDRLSNTGKQLQGLQQVQEMKLMRERAKGDRLEDSMKDARDHEERERDDDAIYDLIDLQFATPASSKLQE